MKTTASTDKGVAGLTILLSLVTFLFVIGLLVMIFSLMGGELINSTYDSTTVTSANESTLISAFPHGLDGLSYTNSICGDVTAVYNGTGGALLGLGNFTQSDFTTRGDNCVLHNASVTTTWASALLVTYSYTYDATNGATDVMNDTTIGIAGVTDWFAIFVVIGAMVVLILLTVIIITAIRGSGLMTGGSA